MANKTASEKNKPTRKTLRQNEFYNPKTKRYEFHYKDIYGKERVVSSYRLEATDQTPKGKRSSKSLREKEEEIKKLLDDNIDIDGTKLTLLEMTNRYVDSLYNKREYAYNTKEGYQYKLKELANHKISTMRLCDINIYHCEEWLKEMKAKYHGSTIKRYIVLLKNTFDYAIECDYVSKNPFKHITVSQKDSKDMKALTFEEMNSFLDFCQSDTIGSHHYNMLYILFWTGLRISELCGLTLDDIDMDNQVIYVRKQLIREGKDKTVSMTKTSNGNRIVPMTDGVYECFNSILKQRNVSEEITYFDKYGNSYNKFVFLTPTSNKPLDRHRVKAYFETCIKRYNKKYPDKPLRKFYPHICRHTFATNMQTLPSKTLQTILGHEDISTTLSYYVDVQPIEQQRDEINSVIDKLNSLNS